MHVLDYALNSTFSASHFESAQIEFCFSPNQENVSNSILPDYKLSELIANKTRHKEFFYSIEVSAHNFGSKKTVLDYNIFGSMMPLFTSLIWFGANYSGIQPLSEVESIRTARFLQSHTTVLPHFTAYRVDKDRLSEFLDLNFRNVLALRGDELDAGQEFKHARDMIAGIRKLRGNSISIGVGGYPEGHAESKNLDDDIEFLSRKVAAGADFIITQVCFSSDAIISFVRRCRQKGITVPIIVGVLVPDNDRSLRYMMKVTGARLPTVDMNSYKMLNNDQSKFRDYAVDSAVNMISDVLNSNLDIYGFHFFTLNRFTNVQKVLQKLTVKRESNRLER